MIIDRDGSKERWITDKYFHRSETVFLENSKLWHLGQGRFGTHTSNEPLWPQSKAPMIFFENLKKHLCSLKWSLT